MGFIGTGDLLPEKEVYDLQYIAAQQTGMYIVGSEYGFNINLTKKIPSRNKLKIV